MYGPEIRVYTHSRDGVPYGTLSENSNRGKEAMATQSMVPESYPVEPLVAGPLSVEDALKANAGDPITEDLFIV